MTATYTRREEKTGTVTRVSESSVTTDDGWTFLPPREHLNGISEGDRIVVETRDMARVTGCRHINGEWLWRYSDEWLDDDHEVFRAKNALDAATRLRDNRADWERREAALPYWVRARLLHFHAAAGRGFETDGWGYELAVAELAVIHAENASDDAVKAYAAEHGTSWNQHQFARVLAASHREDPTWTAAGTFSALSPITGDRYYSYEGGTR